MAESAILPYAILCHNFSPKNVLRMDEFINLKKTNVFFTKIVY